MAYKKPNYKCKLLPFERTDCLSMQEVKQKAGWSITAFNLPDAWGMSQGEGVVIAVIDTGCDLDHPDLVENLLEGKNFVTPNKPPADDSGHGTHVTGTLVACNNDIGVVGVAPKAKVRPVKVLDKNGNGNMKNVAAGIRWAADQKVDLISMSLGSPNPVQEVRKAIQYAVTKGITVFVAAGNAGNTKEVFYPAAYPETISVGAIDEQFKRAAFSNTGHQLDFMAPGVDILSTVPDNWYAQMSGTSMAQPFACGVAALLLAYSRSGKTSISIKSYEDYKTQFRKYTTPVNNGNYTDPEFYQGFGIIDPRKFMEAMKQHHE
jgi:subtilisin family serine protease